MYRIQNNCGRHHTHYRTGHPASGRRRAAAPPPTLWNAHVIVIDDKTIPNY